jgi:hypothetical protein
VQRLEEENRRLRDSSEGLKGQLAPVEAAQQSAVVHLQVMNSITLQSGSAGWLRAAEKPPDYLEKVQRLAAESGQDTRICSRAFAYFNYDYGKALNELRELDT